MPRAKQPKYAKLIHVGNLVSFRPENYPVSVSTTSPFGGRGIIDGRILAMQAVDTDDRRVYVAVTSIQQMRALATTLTRHADLVEGKS